MAELVNLKLHRKRRDRSRREADAAANRAKFGRTREERDLADLERAREVARLDAHKREE